MMSSLSRIFCVAAIFVAAYPTNAQTVSRYQFAESQDTRQPVLGNPAHGQPAINQPVDVILSDRLTQPSYPGPRYSHLPPEITPANSMVPPSIANQQNFKKKIKGAYKGVFFDNNFDYLCDPEFCGPFYFGDPLKNLCFKQLDIGGEVRTRFHRERGIRGLGLTGRDDDFLLTRIRLYADYDFTENVRVYGEYLYADSGGEDFNNRPIEENRKRDPKFVC